MADHGFKHRGLDMPEEHYNLSFN